METWTIYFRDSIGGCSTFFFLMVFFLVFLVFSSTFTDQYLIKDLRIPLQISRALYLCVAPSSLRICFTNISCLVLSRPWTLSSQLCLLNFTKAAVCLNFPSRHSLFQPVSWGAWWARLVCFPFFRDYCSTLIVIRCLRTEYFRIFCPIFSF